ncbi:MAG: hypothetical protein CMI18_11535 [Opitutaceae bacterium]|nr:hypothetical protein [Opitutaceae bacterium]|tara:strand:- start:4611 stop:4814 length:204 start_codon:yes stop_codon:yes gene_type:complete
MGQVESRFSRPIRNRDFAKRNKLAKISSQKYAYQGLLPCNKTHGSWKMNRFNTVTEQAKKILTAQSE